VPEAVWRQPVLDRQPAGQRRVGGGLLPATGAVAVSVLVGDGSPAFEEFFAARARALLDQIASAMGKTIDDFDLVDAALADTGETDDTDDI
jgi:hypothetical protein